MNVVDRLVRDAQIRKSRRDFVVSQQQEEPENRIPEISRIGKSFLSESIVHERLYRQALSRPPVERRDPVSSMAPGRSSSATPTCRVISFSEYLSGSLVTPGMVPPRETPRVTNWSTPADFGNMQKPPPVDFERIVHNNQQSIELPKPFFQPRLASPQRRIQNVSKNLDLSSIFAMTRGT
jgi:hypothetical protein